MDNDKRPARGGVNKKILWVIAIFILLLIVLFWIFKTSDQISNINKNTNIAPPVFTPPSTDLEYKESKTVKESPTEFSVVNLAKSYVARFGSWSTDNQGANLNELLPLSTSRMQNYIQNIEIDLETKEFSGTTTKSLSAKIINVDDNRAEILVNTQKIVTKADLSKEVYYQEAQVKLINSADKWLVDQVIWK